MEAFIMENTLSVLTQEVEGKLIQLHYSERTIIDYQYFWRKLSKYMENNNASEFDQQIAKAFLYEMFEISMTESCKGHSDDARRCRRTLNILLDYQKHGEVYRRQRTISHEFHECYKPVILNYVAFLDSTMAGTTRLNQKYKLMSFLNFLYEHNYQDLSKITKTIIIDYWKTRTVHAKTTQMHDAYVLRTFLNYLYEQRITLVDNSIFVPCMKGNRMGQIPSFYTSDELTSILAAVDRANAVGKRDYAILLFAIRYGMRTGDIRHLTLQSFDWNDGTFSYVQSKTGDNVVNPLLSDVATAVIDYLKNGRPETTCKDLFIRHMAPFEGFGQNTSLQHIVTKYMNRAGFSDLHNRKHGLHSMRHSIAGNLLDQGVPLPTVSEVLGHVKTQNTMIYTKISLNQLASCALEV